MLSLGNCKKLVTFSFDDGNTDDIRLVEILNRCGLKATFNLCSGLPDSSQYWIYEGKKEVRHINFCESKNLYDGHEIASHTVCHPHLEELTEVEIRNEIELDGIANDKTVFVLRQYNQVTMLPIAENLSVYIVSSFEIRQYSCTPRLHKRKNFLAMGQRFCKKTVLLSGAARRAKNTDVL